MLLLQGSFGHHKFPNPGLLVSQMLMCCSATEFVSLFFRNKNKHVSNLYADSSISITPLRCSASSQVQVNDPNRCLSFSMWRCANKSDPLRFIWVRDLGQRKGAGKRKEFVKKLSFGLPDENLCCQLNTNPVRVMTRSLPVSVVVTLVRVWHPSDKSQNWHD